MLFKYVKKLLDQRQKILLGWKLNLWDRRDQQFSEITGIYTSCYETVFTITSIQTVWTYKETLRIQLFSVPLESFFSKFKHLRDYYHITSCVTSSQLRTRESPRMRQFSQFISQNYRREAFSRIFQANSAIPAIKEGKYYQILPANIQL